MEHLGLSVGNSGVVKGGRGFLGRFVFPVTQIHINAQYCLCWIFTLRLGAPDRWRKARSPGTAQGPA